METRLPDDKRTKYMAAVEDTLRAKSLPLRDLQGIIGKLQFATSVIPGVRAFLRRLHPLTRGTAALVPARHRTRREANRNPAAPPALQLHPETVRTLLDSLQPATRRTYQHKWAEYVAYVSDDRRRECPFEASSSTLANFLQSLLSRGLAFRSLSAYLAAIAYMFKLHGREDPTRQFLVTQLLNGVRNKAQRLPARRLPVTRRLLHRLLGALRGVCCSTCEKTCYRALFSLAFYACLRPGEVTYTGKGQHTLRLEQLTLSWTGIDILFASYKHSAGRTPTLTLSADPYSKYCPVRAMANYIRQRGMEPGPTFLGESGAPVTRQDFTWVLRAAIRALELPPNDYAPHSFRIGRATQMSKDGLAPAAIRAVGRWKSDAFHSYVRQDVIPLPR
ncbi:uncharacterized protein [Procambarus clarkii]|uniref:uncharacterized protein n=1 Tax=Procambarus clarkii TaxID=6728 RepID=UPI0037445519